MIQESKKQTIRISFSEKMFNVTMQERTFYFDENGNIGKTEENRANFLNFVLSLDLGEETKFKIMTEATGIDRSKDKEHILAKLDLIEKWICALVNSMKVKVKTDDKMETTISANPPQQTGESKEVTA